MIRASGAAGLPGPYASRMANLPALGARGEGWVALQLVAFAVVALAVWLAPPAPAGDLGLALQMAGYAAGAVGAILIGSGIIELRRGQALTAVPHPRHDARLVRSGAYRFVRHPIYGGLILGAVGLSLIAPWIGTFGATAFVAVVLDLKRRREEAWLASRYPDYDAYRRVTKALIPFVY